MRFLFLFSTLSLAFAPAQDSTAIQTGKIYDVKDKTKLLFLFERVASGPQNKRHVVVRFSSPEGKELSHEEVDYIGDRFRNYVIDKFQTGEHAEIEVEDGKVSFLFRDKNKKEKRNEEPWDDTVITVDELPRLVQEKWKLLKDSRTISFRYVVPQRAETVRFELSIVGSSNCRDDRGALLRMRVGNLFYRPFAPTVLLTVSEKEPHWICEYVGPTSPYSPDLREIETTTVFDSAGSH
jgi:hypothetical protein